MSPEGDPHAGARLKAKLEQFIGNYPELFELVRGEGLMLGIKMKVESRPFFQHLRDKHQLLTVAAGDNTLLVVDGSSHAFVYGEEGGYDDAIGLVTDFLLSRVAGNAGATRRFDDARSSDRIEIRRR